MGQGLLTSCGLQVSCVVCTGPFVALPLPYFAFHGIEFLLFSPCIDLELKHFISVYLAIALDILGVFLISFPSPGPALIPVSAHNVNIDKLSLYLVF